MSLVRVVTLVYLLVGGAICVADPAWQLVWQDEFAKSGAPDPSKWSYHVGGGWHSGLKRFLGWGNDETQFYRPEQCVVARGALRLTAILKSTRTRKMEWAARSCRITTDRKFSFKYGAIEARIALPQKSGFWPAFWMMGDVCNDSSTSLRHPASGYVDRMATNWPACGEIDVLENRDGENIAYQNLHWDAREKLLPYREDQVRVVGSHGTAAAMTAYHVYRVEWTAERITWLIDGRTVATQAITVPAMEELQRPYHVIINLAVGGTFPRGDLFGSDFPATMNVDYVRVYRAEGQ